MTDAPEDVDRSRIIAGRYRLGEPIGEGGRATVFEAVDPMLHRDIAVKVFRPSSSSVGDVRLQEAEARLLAGLNHYALTTLFDAGVDTTDPARPRVYLVMERIPGVDLKRRIQRDGPLTPSQVALLGFDLAEGLQYVHEHGFLHRDIKPANVLIADRNIDTRIRGKLADFGISSLIGDTEGAVWSSGTVQYLSPEQVDGQEPTTASDVYALGLVLLEALVGRPAFPGSQDESAMARLDHDPVIPDSVPAPLAAVLRRMTSLLPQTRPPLSEVALEFQATTLRDLVESGRVDPAVLTTAEDRRMALVRRYNILDTPPDDAFDRITHLACRLLAVPVAAVAIMDADREWFKSRRGIDLQELDRDVALCALSVATGEPFVVPDVRAEERFASNPVVQQDPTLRAFAAVPLLTSDRHSIGTLCVFDRRIRDFTADEIDDLQQLAAVAMRELDLRLASRRALFSS